MYNKHISLLTLLLLINPIFGRPIIPTHPGAVSPAKVVAAPTFFPPDTGLETSGPREYSSLPTLHTLRVQVVDRDSGAPFVLGQVGLVDPQGNPLRSLQSIDSNGLLIFEDVQPGCYLPTLVSTPNGMERHTVCVPRPIVVRPGLEQSVVVKVQAGIPVMGQMTGIGTRIPAIREGATLRAYWAGTEVFVNSAPIHDPDGTWVMYLPEGSFDVYYQYGVDAIHPQGRSSRQPVLISVDRRTPPEPLSLHLYLVIES